MTRKHPIEATLSHEQAEYGRQRDMVDVSTLLTKRASETWNSPENKGLAYREAVWTAQSSVPAMTATPAATEHYCWYRAFRLAEELGLL